MSETVSPNVPPRRPGVWRLGLRDLVGGAGRWRLSYLLGLSEIRRRYARSRLGQFWVTLTMALTIAALGAVWSRIWGQKVNDLMPFVAISMVLWVYIAGILNDAPVIFVSSAPIMHNQGMEFSTLIYGMLFKHLLILLHNIPIILATMVIFGVAPGPGILAAPVGLFLLTIFLLGLSYIVAVTCLRFRDLVQIVQNAVMVLFFMTPILWRPEQITADNAYLLDFNPFAAYLATIQKPLLGGSATPAEWAVAGALAAIMALLIIPLAGWARPRLIYWV